MTSSKKYIYIDTNIISEFKLFSEEQWRLFYMARKKYHFPFSHTHLFDLSNSPERYLEIDIKLLERISDRYGIDMKEDGNVNITRLNVDLFHFYKGVIKQGETNGKEALKNRKLFVPGYGKIIVNEEAMHSNSFLSEMVVKNNGVIDENFPNLMSQYLIENIGSPNVYKKIRRQVQDILAHAKTYNTLKNIPEGVREFLEVFSKDIKDEELFERLKEYRIYALKTIGENFHSMPIPLQIVDIYMILDLVKDYSENISRKNLWINMLRDAEHCGNAWQAKLYITNDEVSKSKLEFIKNGFGLKCRVLNSNEFKTEFLIRFA